MTRTRNIWCPCTHANGGIGSTYSRPAGIVRDNQDDVAYASLQVPEDFVGSGVIKAVVTPTATGNLYSRLEYMAAKDGEPGNTHVGDSGFFIEAVIADYLEVLSTPLALALISKGDNIGLDLWRQGSHANDTIVGNVYVIGFIFEYLADS